MEVRPKLAYPDKEASTCDVDKNYGCLCYSSAPSSSVGFRVLGENTLRGRDREGHDNDGSISERKIRHWFYTVFGLKPCTGWFCLLWPLWSVWSSFHNFLSSFTHTYTITFREQVTDYASKFVHATKTLNVSWICSFYRFYPPFWGLPSLQPSYIYACSAPSAKPISYYQISAFA